MIRVLVTGANGFLGKNLCTALSTVEGVQIRKLVRENQSEIDNLVARSEVIFHCAGVNRPLSDGDYLPGNMGITERLLEAIRGAGGAPKIVFASSIQADLDNSYGKSKLAAESVLGEYACSTPATVKIYRLRNVYGKWCRPNYNSVTATFCYNATHDLPLEISDPYRPLELVYVDDIVRAWIGELKPEEPGAFRSEVPEFAQVTLGELAELITSFRAVRDTLVLPVFDDRFKQNLYATYLSYLDKSNFAYDLTIREDNRGILAEFLKSPEFGQIFVSRTHPGITRGNHYHHTKTEKFLVLEGEGVVRFRSILGDEVFEYPVSGLKPRVVDIPPGYTHSIENVGDSEMVTLFWASEVFDPERPDTQFEAVLH